MLFAGQFFFKKREQVCKKPFSQKYIPTKENKLDGGNYSFLHQNKQFIHSQTLDQSLVFYLVEKQNCVSISFNSVCVPRCRLVALRSLEQSLILQITLTPFEQTEAGLCLVCFCS